LSSFSSLSSNSVTFFSNANNRLNPIFEGISDVGGRGVALGNVSVFRLGRGHHYLLVCIVIACHMRCPYPEPGTEIFFDTRTTSTRFSDDTYGALYGHVVASRIQKRRLVSFPYSLLFGRYLYCYCASLEWLRSS
jgi:hypothetical protein